MRPPVIGLTGPGGVGKSTVARALAAAWSRKAPAGAGLETPVVLHIGEPIKDMLAALLAAAGLSPAEVWAAIYGEGKRAPCPVLGGHTPTDALQTLGTEWGRKRIAPDLWLDIWRGRAAQAMAQGRMVLNDSVRFENEAAAIRDLGGFVVRITGRDGDLDSTHESEKGVVADLEVQNLEGEGGPEAAAQAILDHLFRDRAILADAIARHF